MMPPIRVTINGRRVPPGDVRVTQPERLEEKIRWASYMFREFGAWPGEERVGSDKRDSLA